MGKKRTAIISSTSDEKPVKKKMFKWETAYQDLSEPAATVLKEARIKPDQLGQMADGELLALTGMTPALLEEIRRRYWAQLVEPVPALEVKPETAAVEIAASESKAGDHPRLNRPRYKFGRSALYKGKFTKVEAKSYPIEIAVELLKTIAYSKHKTVELHLNVIDTGLRGEIKLPNSVGKEIKVAIFNADLANEIQAGKLNFDILLARPEDMPQIAPLAKVLGPRGLMPNPKSGTITADPEARAKELASGANMAYKTEPKSPLIHLVVGNLDQKNDELADNIKAVITTIGFPKIKSASLKSTMSPGIKLDFSALAK